jgi:hypothetical protein
MELARPDRPYDFTMGLLLIALHYHSWMSILGDIHYTLILSAYQGAHIDSQISRNTNTGDSRVDPLGMCVLLNACAPSVLDCRVARSPRRRMRYKA